MYLSLKGMKYAIFELKFVFIQIKARRSGQELIASFTVEALGIIF